MSTDRIDRLHIRTQQLSALTFVMTEEAFGDYSHEQQESIRNLVDELAADVKGLAQGGDDEADQRTAHEQLGDGRLSLVGEAASEIDVLAASILRATREIADEHARDTLDRAAATRIRSLADIIGSCVGDQAFDGRADHELERAFAGYLPHEGGGV